LYYNSEGMKEQSTATPLQSMLAGIAAGGIESIVTVSLRLDLDTI